MHGHGAPRDGSIYDGGAVASVHVDALISCSTAACGWPQHTTTWSPPRKPLPAIWMKPRAGRCQPLPRAPSRVCQNTRTYRRHGRFRAALPRVRPSRMCLLIHRKFGEQPPTVAMRRSRGVPARLMALRKALVLEDRLLAPMRFQAMPFLLRHLYRRIARRHCAFVLSFLCASTTYMNVKRDRWLVEVAPQWNANSRRTNILPVMLTQSFGLRSPTTRLLPLRVGLR